MHAIRQHAFGGPDQLVYQQVADPVPSSGQVRIDVGAAGVHFVDTMIRAGTPAGPQPLPELPTIPGREVAGIVGAVGPDVDEAWLGRRVVAHLGGAGGGYAEVAVAAATSLHVLDGQTDPAAAVAMIGTGRTALAILDAAEPSADDVVFVTAAAGGVGTLLVQAALSAGATVIGAAGGPAKIERVRAAGAAGIDYTRDAWDRTVADEFGDRPLSLVLDGVGGQAGRGALELLRPGGRLVVFGWSSGQPTRFDATDVVGRGLTVTTAVGPRLVERPGGLRSLEERSLRALSAGELIPAVESFPLADAVAAHAAIESRRTMGKVVLRPGPGGPS